MNTLFNAFGMLASFGNWAFWLVLVSLAIMVTLTVFFGGWSDPLSCLTLNEHPLLQKIARLSFVVAVLLCPFVECDYLFHGLDHPIGRMICVYVVAVLGFLVILLAYWLTALAIYCLSRVIYWILDLKWPFDD